MTAAERRERRLFEHGVWAERLVWQKRLLDLTEALTAAGDVRAAARIFAIIDRTTNEVRT